MTKSARISRRNALKLAAASATLPLAHMRTAGAAGNLALGFLDHWVPRGNEVMRAQVSKWAERNKVDVALDFITIIGNKILVTAAAEDAAGSGHDVMWFPGWEVHNHGSKLEPVDDVVGRLEARYGKLDDFYRYVARIDGHWMGVPTSVSTVYQSPCARIDYFKQFCGIDLTEMYPAKPVHTALADAWTYETFLTAAQKCAQGGKPFGIGLSTVQDCVDIAGSLCAAFGVQLVDAKGHVTVRSDNTRQLLEYMRRLVPFLPPDVYSFDNATDNRMLIADQSALIYNPPSAWAVAKRDAPHVAERCWTFPTPVGPAGRYLPIDPASWGIWSFSQNKSAAKELIEFLMQREQVRQRCDVVAGFDIPPFDSMLDFDVWDKVEPPAGTMYNYPLRPHHNAKRSFTGMPAPPQIAVQIYNNSIPCNMIAKVTQAGQSIEQAIAWAENELQGYIG
jgi:ABC-type glycerol-3-phosphate transport system substrate-binding protein